MHILLWNRWTLRHVTIRWHHPERNNGVQFETTGGSRIKWCRKVRKKPWEVFHCCSFIPYSFIVLRDGSTPPNAAENAGAKRRNADNKTYRFSFRLERYTSVTAKGLEEDGLEALFVFPLKGNTVRKVGVHTSACLWYPARVRLPCLLHLFALQKGALCTRTLQLPDTMQIINSCPCLQRDTKIEKRYLSQWKIKSILTPYSHVIKIEDTRVQ